MRSMTTSQFKLNTTSNESELVNELVAELIGTNLHGVNLPVISVSGAGIAGLVLSWCLSIHSRDKKKS